MTDVANGAGPDREEPLLIAFFIHLPVSLGLPHGATFFTMREETVDWLAGVGLRVTPESPPLPAALTDRGRNYVSLRIWRPKETLRLPVDAMQSVTAVVREVTGLGQSGENPIPTTQEGYGAVVEAVTALVGAPGQDPVTLAFDRCLDEVTLLTRAYIATTRDLRVRPLSRQHLEPAVLYATRHPAEKDWSSGLLLLHPGFGLPAPASELDGDQLSKLQLHLQSVRVGNPFFPFAEWTHRAEQALRVDGDYATAVVAAHTAGEVLFDTTLLVMAWEEGTPRAVAEGWFEEALAKRLRTHYSSRLGAAWDTTRPQTVPGRWTMHVSAVRNKVVHAGYRPTEEEVATALAGLDAVGEFIKGRLAANVNQYRRTALMLLGRPGLERRGAYSREIARFVDTVAPTEPDWIDSYRRWL